MTGISDKPDQGARLQELFANYLRDQAQAHGEGLGFAEPTDEILPFDAVPVQPVDPRLAWEDALTSARQLLPSAKFATPPQWSELVQGQEPAIALAFALGNFPQLVRNLQPLMGGGDLSVLRQPARSTVPAAILDWASGQKEPGQRLLAAAILRLAGDYDRAAAQLQGLASLDKSWQALAANEEATLAWQRGDGAKAAALWAAQADSAPVLFNRGMAALFLGKAGEAIEPLTRAAEMLPDSSAWHHLARLYLALAMA